MVCRPLITLGYVFYHLVVNFLASFFFNSFAWLSYSQHICTQHYFRILPFTYYYTTLYCMCMPLWKEIDRHIKLNVYFEKNVVICDQPDLVTHVQYLFNWNSIIIPFFPQNKHLCEKINNCGFLLIVLHIHVLITDCSRKQR